MSLLNNFKSCFLLSSEIRCSQLLLPIHQSLSLLIYGAPSSHLYPQNGRRYYRKFSRKPVKVNPAKEDEGKMLLGDYVDQTAAGPNMEVLQETRRLAKVMQAAAASSRGATHNPKREREMLLNNDIKRQQVKHSSERDDEEENYHQDPKIRNALKSIKYVHFHEASSQIKPLLSNCRSRKLRQHHDLVMLEGFKLIQEALSAGVLPVAAFYSRKNLLLKMMPKAMELEEKVERLNSMSIFSMPYRKMNTWSSVVTGQGIIGVFRLSDMAQAHKKKQNTDDSITKSFFPLGSHVTLVLDSVREPGNVGALIRTAAGAGVDKIVLTKGCCDSWESKALRAGCGGHLSVELCDNVPWSRIYTKVPRYPLVYLADVGNSDREPLRNDEEEHSHPDSHAGIRNRDLYDKALKKVFKRSMSDEKSPVKRGDQLDDDGETSSDESDEFFGTYIEVQEDGSELVIDNSFLDVDHLQQFADAELPLKFINEVNFFSRDMWRSQNIVLVVGGETGLSTQAKKFAHDNFGCKVSIPLHSGVDSLNTSVASGVIIYEMWKQLQSVSDGLTVGQIKEEASE